MLFVVLGGVSVSQQRCNHFLTESEMESVHLSLFTVIECVLRCGSAWPSTPVRFDKEAQKDRREHKANRDSNAYWTGQSTKTERTTTTHTHTHIIRTHRSGKDVMDMLERKDSQRQSTYGTESLKKNKWWGIDYGNVWQAWGEDRWRTEKMRCI